MLSKLLSKNYWIVYVFVSLLVTGGFVTGYFFSLDTYFAQKIDFKDNSFWMLNPWKGLVYLFTFFNIPMYLFEWLLMFGIVFLSGYSMHKFVEGETNISPVAGIFGGILYSLNPFVYTRFMAGHIFFLLGYALFPIVLKEVMSFLEEESNHKKQLTYAALGFFVIGTTTIHNFLILSFATAIIVILKLFELKNVAHVIKNTTILAVVVLLLSSYWVFPAVTEKSSLIEQITEQDVSIFQTRQESGVNVLVAAATLHGFWRGMAYINPNDVLPAPVFYGISALILFFAVYGFVTSEDKKKYPLAVLVILAFLLSLGVSWEPTGVIFESLLDSVVPLIIFREPHKLLSLLIFGYAYFGGKGINKILREPKEVDEKRGAKSNKNTVFLFILIATVVPALFGITMFGNFWGQVQPTDYPEDWYNLNKLLNNDSSDFDVLFLPWHMYMDFKWLNNSDKRLINPASGFFDKNVIGGDNIEVGDIYSQSTDQKSKYIEFLIREGKEGNSSDIGSRLANMNIKYVVLTKEGDYQTYGFLSNQTNIQKIKETDNFYVYKIENPVGKIYGMDIQSNATEKNFGEFGMELKVDTAPIEYEKTLFGYRFGGSDKEYTVFTESFDKNWKLENEYSVAPIAYLGTNAYRSTDGELIWERAYIFIIGGIISFITLIFLFKPLKGENNEKNN